jgi:tetratricopeptide (TPR) repeat protein
MEYRRISLILGLTAVAVVVHAQAPDPADAAYQALRAKDYERAIGAFQKALTLSPGKLALRKDLAYTLLKIGDTEAARDQFAEVMRADPKDQQVALEYAFLCYETKQPVAARRVFDRLRLAGNATAAEAFENVDRPLREGIARWQEALASDPGNFSAHEELARLAEQRDDWTLAAEHFERAWRLRVDRRDLLLDLARVWKLLGRSDESTAALIAAWRGATPRVSEQAHELLPSRYPYLSEFERALALDPGNAALRRDVAYQKGDRIPSPQPELIPRPTPPPAESGDPKTLGLKSLEKGYLPDALKYLQIAHETDPVDFEVMLKLGWTYNEMKDDRTALHWFDLARRSPDTATAAEASRAYGNLAPDLKLFRTTVWAFPVFSSRWHDLFGYAQIKTELRLRWLPLRPYVSARFVGDTRGEVNAGFGPQYLSERSVILAVGLATVPWHRVTGWFEAGESLAYSVAPSSPRRGLPDYRGGLSYTKGFGHLLGAGSHGLFAESSDDGIFVSRFSNDSLLYSQNKAGYTLRALENWGGFQSQVLWNANLTVDAQRQYWANYVETGPGARFRFPKLPFLFSTSLLRGAYLVNRGNPRGPNYNEVRVGVWYSFSR